MWLLFYLFLILQYLNQGSYEVPSLNDTQDYKLMTESMEKVGFSLQEKDNIFRIVAAVMHLGNIAFEEKLDDKQGRFAIVLM